MESLNYRVGNGIDVHPLKKGRKLILGGIHIHHDYGCDGHSDGDVVVHSIIDSILGALNAGDIGSHFPSNNQKYKDINSCELLKTVFDKYNFTIINIDSTIILQEPMIQPYIVKIKKKISDILKTKNISIKATTTDHLGFIGSKQGVAALTTCMLINNDKN